MRIFHGFVLAAAASMFLSSPAEATRTKADQQRRAALKQTLTKAWKAHAEKLVSAANSGYKDDEIKVGYSVGRMVERGDKISFAGELKYESHPGVEPSTVKVAMQKDAVAKFEVDGGAIPAPLGKVDGAARRGAKVLGKKGFRVIEEAILKLRSIDEMTAFVNEAVAHDPLALDRIQHVFSMYGAPPNAGAWYIALRARTAKPAAWPAPREPLAFLPKLIAGAEPARNNLYAHAVYTLEHPDEILAFVRFVDAHDPVAGLHNAKFAGTEYISNASEKAWKKAVEIVEAERGQPQPAWLQKLLARGPKTLSPYQAVRNPDAYVRRLTTEAKKAGYGDFARYALGKATQAEQIAVVVAAVKRERGAPGLENLKFLATVYDTKPAESELWAQAIARATP